MMFVWGSKESVYSTSEFVSEDLSNNAKDDGARCSAAARVAEKDVCPWMSKTSQYLLMVGKEGRCLWVCTATPRHTTFFKKSVWL